MYLIATILYIIVGIDHVNLVWLHPLPCKILLQLIWLYMDKCVAMQV